ncbi:MAG: TMEM175 family protein [Caldilineaceae bacterium]
MAEQKAETVPGTLRLEAFSDGVLAIIVTLLVLDLKAPQFHDFSTRAVLRDLVPVLPPFVSFAFSFFSVAIFWVNHHHFFATVKRTDWRLLWYNNLLLFWLAVVPFTTSLIGAHPTVPAVVAIYALNMCLASSSFSLMRDYVFFRSRLLPDDIEQHKQRQEFKRSLVGPIAYAVAAGVALLYVYAALLLLILIPLYFIIPNLLVREAPQTNE